jgi:hypothetical protein
MLSARSRIAGALHYARVPAATPSNPQPPLSAGIWHRECLFPQRAACDSTVSGPGLTGIRRGGQCLARRFCRRAGAPPGIAEPEPKQLAGSSGGVSEAGGGCPHLRGYLDASRKSARFVGCAGDRVPLRIDRRDHRCFPEWRPCEAGVLHARLPPAAGGKREKHDFQTVWNGAGSRWRPGPQRRRGRTRKDGRTVSGRAGRSLCLPELR